MTSLLEKFISVIAPNHCILCSKENNVLCSECHPQVFAELHEACYICDMPSVDGRPCVNCRAQTPLAHVWIAGTYDELRQTLIRKYKFARLQSAYKPLVAALEGALPYLEDVVVVPIPTASAHVRVRGYDHAALLAKELAGRKGWLYAPVLRRRHSLRQVGASKAVRAKQASEAFELGSSRSAIRGKRILLVDDVTTSGATLTAAARILQSAEPAELCAVVAAKHTLS